VTLVGSLPEEPVWLHKYHGALGTYFLGYRSLCQHVSIQGNLPFVYFSSLNAC